MSGDILLSSAPLSLAEAAEGSAPLSVIAGGFFAFRVFFVLLAVRVFQAEAEVGVAAGLVINDLLLMVAMLSPGAKRGVTTRQILQQPCFVCAAAYLALTGLSLSWSVADSLPAAVVFWIAMVADAGIIFFQLREHAPRIVMEAIARGYVYGASVVACIAWIIPAQSDMRLGDEELLGPNQIGWLCGVAFFFAQYLFRKKAAGRWGWYAALLGVTLLRSLSKTTILAFVAAQVFLLLKDSTLARATKVRVVLCAGAVLAVFGGMISSYLDQYSSSNSPESLTGRLGIWAYILAESLDNPLFGHGFHSVWKVIPPFYGDFQARHAHNEFLQQFYAYGAVGLLLLLTTYTRIGMTIRRMDSRNKAFWGSFLLFVLVRCLADTEVFDYSWPIWLVVLFGAIAAHDRAEEGCAA